MSDSMQILAKMMDGAAMRHRVLANNVANADTPRFKRQDVRFRDALQDALDSNGGKEAISSVTPEVYEDYTTPSRPDGNNVSLQKEIGEMAENNLLYQFAARGVDRKYEQLRRAIKGR